MSDETVAQSAPDPPAPAAAAGGNPGPDATQTPSLDEEQQRLARLASRHGRIPPKAPGYRTLQWLGEGGFGEVWLAEDEGVPDIKVAIKFFKTGPNRHWDALLGEVKPLTQLDAVAGIVQLKEVDIDADPPYLVMSYAEGGSLTDRLTGPLPVPQALAWFRRVAAALAQVHAKGIIHCDLKPSNILFDRSGNPLIADFGQAQLVSDSSLALGTYFFMPPEQARPEKQLADTRWDVYALGALLACMLTGRRPRHRPGLEDELRRPDLSLTQRLERYRRGIEQAAPPGPDLRRVPGVDRSLAAVVERCLALDPERRYRNADAVLEALNRRYREKQRRPLLWYGLLAPFVLMLLVGGLTYLGVRDVLAERRRQEADHVLETNRYIARLAADTVGLQLADSMHRVQEAAKNPRLLAVLKRHPGPVKERDAEAQRLLGAIQAKNAEWFPRWFLANRAGWIVGIRPDVTFDPVSYRWMDWFNGQGDHPEEPAKSKDWRPIDKPYISHPYQSKSLGKAWLVSISAPVWDEEDPDAPAVAGVLAASLKMKDFNDRLVKQIFAGGGRPRLPDSFVSIFNARGQCLWHDRYGRLHPEPDAAAPGRSGAFQQFLTRAERGSGAEPNYQDPIDGKTYLAGYAPIDGRAGGGFVVVQQPADLIDASAAALRRRLLLEVALAVLLTGVLSVSLWGWLYWNVRRAEQHPPSAEHPSHA
jgi:eukaryotic-like serine/threonine-protein kinase